MHDGRDHDARADDGGFLWEAAHIAVAGVRAAARAPGRRVGRGYLGMGTRLLRKGVWVGASMGAPAQVSAGAGRTPPGSVSRPAPAPVR
ncbi:hypothetical protein GCM10010345_92550 [Streptomyces canarius]|uniref:Uncharacterized protein n=1 Tax=Streptomyces canarius TaxID=285453 RepID=A0ABQ3DBH8_9ACTN|nr:hypothetical protein GCM10010345_92550 [Streptomyces canarius]